MSDSLRPHGLQHFLQTSLSFTISRSLPKFMSIASVMSSNHLILCRPLLLLPLVFPSIRVFSNESTLRIRWPKNWSFSISPSKEYLGLMSFKIDWFDLLAFQGTLESSPAPQFKNIHPLRVKNKKSNALSRPQHASKDLPVISPL